MIDIDLKAIQRRVEYDTYGGLKPYRMGQTAEQYAQDYTDNPQDYVPPPAPEEAIAPKFEGDWFTPVFRQNQATSWLESKFKYAPLLLQGGDGNAPIIKKEELQKRYGDAVGFNFSRDMSEARAKIIADDYKQQVEDARIASNFTGNSILNKINFSAPTILANVPSAVAEEVLVWGGAAALAPFTGGWSLAGAGAVTLAHSVSLATKLQKVATTARRVLDVSSDVYRTGSKGSQVIKTLAHSTLIENGVGSVLTTVNELKQGASYKNAIEMGATQFGVGLVANPAVRYAGIGLGKGVGKVVDIYKGSRVDESIHPVKMLSDVLDEVKTEAEASNASFARNTLEGTNLERSAKDLESVYSDVVMEDLGGMIDVVSRSDNLDMDFSKPIIKSADETLGEVIDNTPYKYSNQGIIAFTDRQTAGGRVIKSNASFGLSVPRITGEQQANAIAHRFQNIKNEKSIPNLKVKEGDIQYLPIVGEKIGSFNKNLDETIIILNKVLNKIVDSGEGNWNKNRKQAGFRLLEGVTLGNKYNADEISSLAKGLGLDPKSPKLKTLFKEASSRSFQLSDITKQELNLTDYNSLVDRGRQIADTAEDFYNIAQSLDSIASQYGNPERAIRRLMQGIEQSDQASKYNMSDFQDMFSVKGYRPASIERVLDAPVDPNKTINLKETGEHLGELSTSTQELTQNIELVASKHSNPDVARQKLLLGASSSIDPEKINLEQAGDALGVKKTESFYGDIVKPDPLANVDIKPSTVGRMIEGEEASTYSVRQAEKLDGKHGAVAEKESLEDAVMQQLALDLRIKGDEVDENPTIIDDGLNDLIREGQAPPDLIELVRDMKEQGFDREIMKMTGDSKREKKLLNALNCKGFYL